MPGLLLDESEGAEPGPPGRWVSVVSRRFSNRSALLGEHSLRGSAPTSSRLARAGAAAAAPPRRGDL
jgi:hypothetical protein